MAASESAKKYCPKCGAEIDSTADICHNCGVSQTAESSRPNSDGDKSTLGLVVAVVGVASGLIGILFLPILFGPIAMVCGVLAYVFDREVIGIFVVLWGVAATVIGILLGLLLVSMVPTATILIPL